MTTGSAHHDRWIWHKHGTLKKKILISILVFCIFVYVYYALLIKDIIEDKQKDIYEEGSAYQIFAQNRKYLINTSTCKIPDVDPFNVEVKKFVHKEKYTSCSNLKLLTYIEKIDGLATLRINANILSQYSYFHVQCCYSKIYRVNYQVKSDNEVGYSPCIKFRDGVVLTYPFVRVQCFNLFRRIYSNVHAVVIPARNLNVSVKHRGNRFSVLLVGIDSMSKQNLKRAMPKTHFLLEKHFYNLKGYNKIGDNTFPNLMAILTGQNSHQLEDSCRKEAKVDECDLIWNTFKALGYVTAYAEDEVILGTFNYNRPGFRNPPTDYYYRPYVIASEELGATYRYGMTYCAGPETSGERILNLVRDFSASFRDVPSFGLFWMNSFSHDYINMPSAMDEKVFEFLNDVSFRSSLRDTVMVFFSDHGFRFGDIRYTHTGWLEERLPFIYIHIPESFKRQFREKYENLLVNTERLTTPFDLYCTLQELLEIGNGSYEAKKSRGCPNCQSLFKEVAENRTCRQAAIDQHWCTCTAHSHVDSRNDVVREVARYIVNEINVFVESFAEGRNCSKYNLRDILADGMSEYYLNENNRTVRYFLVVIETEPNARFEATVEVHPTAEGSNFKLLGDISRINRYKFSSECVMDAMLKKYCYCVVAPFKRLALCTFLNC